MVIRDDDDCFAFVGFHAAGSDEGRGSGSSAPNDEGARKERVLHARIPEHLDEAIREAAGELGMSVSNLVRNVLANALDVVEAATAKVPRSAAAAAANVRARSEAAASAAAAAEKPATVLGWQEAILNLNAVCDRCNAILPRGTRAGISVPDRGSASRAIRCQACLEELTREPGK